MKFASRGGGNSRRGSQNGQESGAVSATGSTPTLDEAATVWIDPNKKIIEPDHGFNFKPDPVEVVHKIVKCITGKYDQAWASWKKVPKDIQDLWFGEFKKVYQWHPQHSSQIRKNFDHKAGDRLKNIFNRARQSNKCPEWMSDGVWKQLVEYWKSEEFVLKSEQGKKNRSSDVGGLGTSLHRGGSIPTTERKRRLEKEKGCVVSDIDVFLDGHQKKDKSWIDKRSAETYEKFTKAWEDLEKSQDTEEIDSLSVQRAKDKLFAQINTTKKGIVYGLGSEGGKYKSSSRTNFASTSYMEEQVEKEKKIAEEMDALRKENVEQKEELKNVNEKLDFMMKMVSELNEKKKKKKKKRKSKENEDGE